MSANSIVTATLALVLLACAAAFVVRPRLPYSRHAQRLPPWLRRALERAIPPDPAQQIVRGLLVGGGALIVAQLARYFLG